MASSRTFAALALMFFIALSFPGVDVAVATRKLLAPTTTLPQIPGLVLPALPPGPGGIIPDLPTFPDYRLPPPMISFPAIPPVGDIPTFPIFPPATTTTP
ncbi:protein PELPK2-like [Juglans regia]|uniref:Protein PELPK2-like n=1 Tax=Juglans regia TaxID=51240 RepID=A0A2I4F5D3_JUGRE|nr:protein PELPK2-like [Juglans regia]XP_035542154.1 protein PELPK2-like [Juglans regia]